MGQCRFCKKEVEKKKNCFGLYCSNACQGAEKSKKIFTKYLEKQTPENLFDASGQIKRGIRRHLIEWSGGKCSICGWAGKRFGQDVSPLEIDHADSNWKNCNLTNLRVLCPNCHSLTDSYKGANKGYGRENRRKECLK
jgi:5-methylcytosine-specific restriction endonuclease McrA